MAEPIGHRKSCLVLSARFQSLSDVPILLLNQLIGGKEIVSAEGPTQGDLLVRVLPLE